MKSQFKFAAGNETLPKRDISFPEGVYFACGKSGFKSRL